MAIYALWNNKGGVGKSYLTFQIACEYARTHPNEKILVIDMCPQANSSSMLLGGMIDGEKNLEILSTQIPRKTISGYIEDRIVSPYVNPLSGASYLTNVKNFNGNTPENLYLVVGDETLELQSSRISGACNPGPQDAWRTVHTWLSDLISDVRKSWNVENSTVFIDCNPSFTIHTELALSASDRLIIPFSADGSSKRAVKAVLSLIYGIVRMPGSAKSEFHLNSERWRLSVPQLYCYVGNRLTQMNNSSASAFKTVVTDIGQEIWSVWTSNSGKFYIHPKGGPAPSNRVDFRKMFQYEINDANTASVVSGALGIPINKLTAGRYEITGRKIVVNQSQLDRQQPNIQSFVNSIE